jgi:hypothetical protein
MDDQELNSYQISDQEIDKEYGLRTNLHNSPLFSVSERHLYDSYLNALTSFDDEVKDKDYKEGDPIFVAKKVQWRQKSLQLYRSTVKSEIDMRMRAVYAPYLSKKERREVRSVSIRDLMDKIQGTVNYWAFFPRATLAIVGVRVTVPSDTHGLQGCYDRTAAICLSKREANVLTEEQEAMCLAAIDEFSGNMSRPGII